jgi:hypothetical protein
MTTEQEGPRGFGPFLSRIDDGRVYDDLGEQLQKLCGELDQYAQNFGKAKGELSVNLKLSVEANGVVSVVVDVKTKAPKVTRPKSIFWLTKGNNLSPENPRQQKLPLREVAPVAAPVEAVAKTAEVRGL